MTDNLEFVSKEFLFKNASATLKAVWFANNFTNSFYCNAAFLLEEQNLSFRLLHPLILETAIKAIELNPYKAQTGPALRNDKLTINKHLQLLESHPELKNLYQLLTNCIQAKQKD